MPLTIEFTQELEAKVRREAESTRLDAAEFVLMTVRDRLERHSGESVPHLSRRETTLLEEINEGMPQHRWQAYHGLLAKRRAEALTPSEQQALIQFSDEIEERNARRLEKVAELARVRGTTLEALARELGIDAPTHA